MRFDTETNNFLETGFIGPDIPTEFDTPDELLKFWKESRIERYNFTAAAIYTIYADYLGSCTDLNPFGIREIPHPEVFKSLGYPYLWANDPVLDTFHDISRINSFKNLSDQLEATLGLHIFRNIWNTREVINTVERSNWSPHTTIMHQLERYMVIRKSEGSVKGNELYHYLQDGVKTGCHSAIGVAEVIKSLFEREAMLLESEILLQTYYNSKALIERLASYHIRVTPPLLRYLTDRTRQNHYNPMNPDYFELVETKTGGYKLLIKKIVIEEWEQKNGIKITTQGRDDINGRTIGCPGSHIPNQATGEPTGMKPVNDELIYRIGRILLIRNFFT